VVVAEAPRDAPTRGYFAEGEGDADGTLYEHAPDWGEAKVGMRRSVLLLLNVEASSCVVLAPGSTELSFGTPAWVPAGGGDGGIDAGCVIVCTGTYQSVQDGVSHGVTGCVQRKTSLFAASPHTPALPAVELLGGAFPTARCEKRISFAPYYPKSDGFTKTGSGQNKHREKHSKRSDAVFLQATAAQRGRQAHTIRRHAGAAH